jgi:uncharacterized protein
MIFLKMKVLFHLGHPAHFHLFKNVINTLNENGHQTNILIKKKDILEELLNEYGLNYLNILPEGRKDSKFGIAIGQFKQFQKLLRFCLKNKPAILIGSTPTVAQVGSILRLPSIVLSEDDAEAVSLFAKTTYPFATYILSPDSCYNGKWDKKTIKYNSYHELAYLHPNHFKPEPSIVSQYLDLNEPYFLLRFSSLNAYHDTGISGISADIATKIINKIEPFGKVLISSERKLPSNFEKYRIGIKSSEMHHFLAFAKIYIGDSQTMAAEAGVLGTPFIRINDFVGKLGYLDELENKYKLGYGILPGNINKTFEKIDLILNSPNLKNEWLLKREIMLNEKCDFSEYLLDFIKTVK